MTVVLSPVSIEIMIGSLSLKIKSSIVTETNNIFRCNGAVHKGPRWIRTPVEGPRRQSVMCTHVRRGSRGATSHLALRRLHQVVLRAEPLAEGGIDVIRVQGQCGNLPSGEKIFQCFPRSCLV